MKVYTLTLVNNSEGCTPIYAKAFNNYDSAYAQMKSEYEKVIEEYPNETDYQIKDNSAYNVSNTRDYIFEYFWNIYESELDF